MKDRSNASGGAQANQGIGGTQANSETADAQANSEYGEQAEGTSVSNVRSPKVMRRFRRIITFVVLFNALMLFHAFWTFRADQQMFDTNNISSFNDNWTLILEDGTTETVSLPLQSRHGLQTVILENTLPRDFAGKTLLFDAASLGINVTLDGIPLVGLQNHQDEDFGGVRNEVHFLAIPDAFEQGLIRIELETANSHGTVIGPVRISEREIAVLRHLQENLSKIICSVVLVICGLIFFVLCAIKTISRRHPEGMLFLGLFSVDAAIYFMLDTKTISLFYQNFRLSDMIYYTCLNLMPFFLAVYYQHKMSDKYFKCFRLLILASVINLCLYTIMLPASYFWKLRFDMGTQAHILILIIAVAVWVSHFRSYCCKDGCPIALSSISLIFLVLGEIIDVVRIYSMHLGAEGDASRFGTTMFCMFTLLMHSRQVSHEFLFNVRENARLLQREVDMMEEQNHKLTLAKDEAELARNEAEHARETAEQARAEAEQAREAAEHARLEAESARAEADHANQAKGRFLANMSHEIRTPINAVLGMDAMILRETREPEIKSYAMDIQSAGNTLLSLVNDILDFSKIESGKMEIIPAEYDFSSMINDLYNMIGSRAATKGLDFHIHVDPDLPSRLYGDDVRIRQVLTNILTNGVKYTQTGSVTLSVTGTRIDCGEDGCPLIRNEDTSETFIPKARVKLHFSVKDTGIGIKQEDIDKLFVEFTRIEEKRNRRIEGTGLGMNITAQLLSLMDSRLVVESVYGEGSEFSFDLTQPIVQDSPIGNIAERIRRQNESYEYTVAFTAPDARILVVDDNEVNRRVFRALLKQTLCLVDEADSGRACLDLTRQNHYDAIFLDHMMPEMDGIETLHHLQKRREGVSDDLADDKGLLSPAEQNPPMEPNPPAELNPSEASDLPGNRQPIPIIALTANAVAGAREMYLEEGFDDFLSKPLQPEKLEKMIMNYLPSELVHTGDRCLEDLRQSGFTMEESCPCSAEAAARNAVDTGRNASSPAVTLPDGTQISSLEDMPVIDGTDWNYGLSHLPTLEMLVETVQNFCRGMLSEADYLRQRYDEIFPAEESESLEKDTLPAALDLFRIKVHAMKSSAALFGCTPLSGPAALLEFAARDGRLDIVREMTPAFLSEWERYREKLRVFMGVRPENAGAALDEASLSRISDYLRLLEDTMNRMDVDGADDAMNHLKHYSYPEKAAAALERLEAIVMNLDTDSLPDAILTFRNNLT